MAGFYSCPVGGVRVVKTDWFKETPIGVKLGRGKHYKPSSNTVHVARHMNPKTITRYGSGLRYTKEYKKYSSNGFGIGLGAGLTLGYGPNKLLIPKNESRLKAP